MSLDLYPLSPADLVSLYEHADPDGDVPADEQPVQWDDDDEYREDDR